METCEPKAVTFTSHYIVMHKMNDEADSLETTPTDLNDTDTMTTDEATPTQRAMTSHTSASLVSSISLSMSLGLPRPSPSSSISSVQVAMETEGPIATPPPTTNGGENRLLHNSKLSGRGLY